LNPYNEFIMDAIGLKREAILLSHCAGIKQAADSKADKINFLLPRKITWFGSLRSTL
jgi:hypothetical protein